MITPPWVDTAKLKHVTSNSMLLQVSLPLGEKHMVMAAVYAPHSLIRCQALIKSFWQGLGQHLAVIEVPLVLGINANYSTFPHNKKSKRDWEDVKSMVPAIAACWGDLGLVDTFVVKGPSLLLPTWFQCHTEEDLVQDAHLVLWSRLVQDEAC